MQPHTALPTTLCPHGPVLHSHRCTSGRRLNQLCLQAWCDCASRQPSQHTATSQTVKACTAAVPPTQRPAGSAATRTPLSQTCVVTASTASTFVTGHAVFAWSSAQTWGQHCVPRRHVSPCHVCLLAPVVVYSVAHRVQDWGWITTWYAAHSKVSTGQNHWVGPSPEAQHTHLSHAWQRKAPPLSQCLARTWYAALCIPQHRRAVCKGVRGTQRPAAAGHVPRDMWQRLPEGAVLRSTQTNKARTHTS